MQIQSSAPAAPPVTGLHFFGGPKSFVRQDTHDRSHVLGRLLGHSQVSSGLITGPSYTFPFNNAHVQTNGTECYYLGIILNQI